MNTIQRVEKMEAIMNATNAQLEALNAALEQLENAQQDIAAFSQYYGSQEWFDDRETELPSTVHCGVLGEDLPYNTVIDYRESAIRMLELATKMLKNI